MDVGGRYDGMSRRSCVIMCYISLLLHNDRRL